MMGSWRARHHGRRSASMPRLDGLSHYPLGFAVAIHLGRVDQRHAEIDAEPERGDLVATAPPISPMRHVPWPRRGTTSPPGSCKTGMLEAGMVRLNVRPCGFA